MRDPKRTTQLHAQLQLFESKCFGGVSSIRPRSTNPHDDSDDQATTGIELETKKNATIYAVLAASIPSACIYLT